MTASASHRRHLASQLLRPEDALRDPVAITGHLVAIQAQDPRGARLAIRARSIKLTAADVDRALSEDRSLVISWLNRGTLHMVRREDHDWLRVLTAQGLVAAASRRLAEEGLDARTAERAVNALVKALEDGPMTRDAMRKVLKRRRIPAEGQALLHVLVKATIEGHVVRGPIVGKEQAFVLTRDWLGEPEPIDRDDALKELGRRYLAAYAPAVPEDLARWAGIGLTDARRAFELAGDPPLATGATPKLPPPRLLGSFDPAHFGWTTRTELLGDATSIVTKNGIFRPFALVNGVAAATWTMRDGTIELAPFAPLKPGVARDLEIEAADVARFLGA